MKILLTGSTGQLGKSVINSKPENIQVIIPQREKLDLLNPKNCEDLIISEKPDWIINCAAYTNVDKAENDIEFSKIALEEKGVALVPGSSFGDNACKFVRISFANSLENIREAIKRLSTI